MATRVTEYTVSAWPDDLPDPYGEARYWSIQVRPTMIPGKWAVTHFDHSILTLGGNWSMAIPRGLRRAHYRDLDRALADAEAAALTLTVNGRTVADIVAVRRAEGGAA